MRDAEPVVVHGDCLDVMPTMGAASVDAIVCDPPYGLGFMGKQWDHGVPGVAFWCEALRVAKPGAHLLAFGGTRTYHRLACAIEDAGWEIRDCLSWLYGSGFPKSHNGPWGGTALKPAWEPIIFARKPLVGTVAANVAEHGTGALNVDGCRIPFAGEDDEAESKNKNQHTRYANPGSNRDSYSGNMPPRTDYDAAGRWPANVCVDEDAAVLIGEPARFFYCAKASRSERESGLDGMPQRVNLDLTSGDRARENDRAGTNRNGPLRAANHHPTVKPIKLMRWLCRLVTPPGGLVLDPFTGSGSTGCAAVLEGFRFVGIERQAEYVEIARRRIRYWLCDQSHPDLFDIAKAPDGFHVKRPPITSMTSPTTNARP